MSQELSKTYEPHAVEDRWIDVWLKRDLFNPDKFPGKTGKAFSIVIPPPNVTGSLHMGHALNNTVQDILVRYHRMKGDDVLWVVGTDHAGIATQNVVERQLKEEGQSRFDLGREKFVERVWKWKAQSGGTIINQLKRLGASCDFSNERFTMDEGLSHAVKKVFVQLYSEKLIYRGERLINWCPRCQTALSDLEVEHEDQKGNLWHIKYPVVGTNEFLIVATTRPETLLGDTAVSVNPDDERYQKFIGKQVTLPLTDRTIPVIADSFVDKEFGSGVVKITPAHDFNDFEAGNRHKLPRINILNADGTLNANTGSYQGLTVTKARDAVIKALEEKELLEKVEPHGNKVGHCYRCRAVVEPYLSTQWYVATKPLAEKAMQAVRKGETKFVPEHWEKTYFNWMENITDWCISRQIWWGHQIPAWYCDQKCEVIVSESTPASCPKCGSKNLTQDPDVLDTWFSSGLWPFSTLGWPDKTPRLQKFYPTSVLVTAFDIIFFWVARMMMMGIHFDEKNRAPFSTVHIHALVRDPMGQKMSKSKGNVVDPLIMMEKYGTDAFRFTLAAFAAQGRDIKLDEARIEGYRNFCNKIWNASRFALMNASSFIKSENDFASIAPQDRVNQWIVNELNSAIAVTSQAIESFEFNKAASIVYKFFWQNFCDWYLELTKSIYAGSDDALKKETAQTTYFVIDTSLKLLHPFMPFITEEIWQFLGARQDRSIVLETFPETNTLFDSPAFAQSAEEIRLLIQTVSAVRGIRQETGLSANQALEVEVRPSDATNKKLFEQVIPMICRMAQIKKFDLSDQGEVASAWAKIGKADLKVPLDKNGIDATKEKDRQTKNLAKVNKDIDLLKKRLEDPKFMENAEAELITEKKAELIFSQEKCELIERELKSLI